MSQHKTPCKECPWKRSSCTGWLGGELAPEEWVELAHNDSVVPCHLKPPAQCVGVAIYRANTCKSPRDKLALRMPADRDLVFVRRIEGGELVEEFVDHHRSTGIVSSEIE
jgi:hypothetical protein